MSISREDVLKVAQLSRLHVDEAELDELTSQLGRILAYVDQLEGVDVSGVEPLAHAMDVVNAFAADEHRPSLDRNAALANAPSRDEECYRVPPVLE